MSGNQHFQKYTEEVVEQTRKLFAWLADGAESEAWAVLYLDVQDCLDDVLSAWRGEVEP